MSDINIHCKKITRGLPRGNSQGLIGNKSPESSIPSSPPPIFILCEVCYWCATYVDKTRIPIDNICPECGANNNELSSLPIASNESFTFDYNNKRGVEMEFKPRRKYA
jgi:hypothetical protein